MSAQSEPVVSSTLPPAASLEELLSLKWQAWAWVTAVAQGRASVLNVAPRDPTPGRLRTVAEGLRFLSRCLDLAAACGKVPESEHALAKLILDPFSTMAHEGRARACSGCGLIWDVREALDLERQDLGTLICPGCKLRHQIADAKKRAEEVVFAKCECGAGPDPIDVARGVAEKQKNNVRGWW